MMEDEVKWCEGGEGGRGGRFDFDDGGTYLGGWQEGKAHGHGVCTGPKGQGAYAGSWHYGFEVSGIYTWPSGSAFEGQWQNGKRHGLGVEWRGRWLYKGEWTQGFKGRYGLRQSATSNAKYEGTWANGLQDGYGSETYADGGTYQGQWLRGMRHGYGVRASAPFGMASHYRPNKTLRASLTSLRSAEGGAEAERDRRVDDSRGGFVLKARSDEPPPRRSSLVEKSSNIKKSILSGLKMRKQRSTGELEKRGTSGGSIRSTGSSASWVSTESSHSGVTTGSIHTDSNASFVVEDEHMDGSVTETYLGEWKNDKRAGFGISERSDGLRYEGEWFNNKKYGYGVTTFRDGSKEEGKYKNNVLITSRKKKHLFLIRSAKFRERIDAAVNAAQRASKIALQKADIAISRTATARGKAELADIAADHAREDFELARTTAKQFAPDFTLPGLDKLRSRDLTKLKAEENKVEGALRRDGEQSLPGTPAPRIELPPQQPQQQPPPQPPLPPQPPPSQQPVANVQYTNAMVNQVPSKGPDHSYSEHNYTEPVKPPEEPIGYRPSIRRNSKQVAGESPSFNFQQAMSDHFDHYKRPPSRDSSVDRFSRGGGGRLSQSRQPSVEKGVEPVAAVAGPGSRGPSMPRGATPVTGNGAAVGPGVPAYTVPSQEPLPPPPLMRKRESAVMAAPLIQPKRTESLYITPQRKEPRPPPPKAVPVVTLQRKKSLPEVQVLPKATEAMSREEVSLLSSARREEVRRMQEENDRLRQNPLLYLFSPHVKDWFSRQQLVMLILFLNISLAIMFFKLLT